MRERGREGREEKEEVEEKEKERSGRERERVIKREKITKLLAQEYSS